MRPHGHVQVSATNPRAKAVCDRCGAHYNHDMLQWQFQWAGPKLQNLYILVCQPCLDIPQEQLRTIVLPADPPAILNPRPEQYVPDSNPNSPIGQNPDPRLAGTNVGNLTGGAGTWTAFDGNSNKRRNLSAYKTVSTVGYDNWVGKAWSVDPSGINLSSVTGMNPTLQELIAASFTAYAPLDAPFSGAGAVGYKFQGSNDGLVWTDLASGTTAGTVGETLTVTVTSGPAYQWHRLNFNGDGVNTIAIALLSINTANRGTPGLQE